MTLKELVSKAIEVKLETIKKLVLESGISEMRYEKLIKNIEKLNDKAKGLVNDDLTDIQSNEFKEAWEIKKLLPDEVWQRYRMMEIYNMREQVLLRQRLKKLKAEYVEIEEYVKNEIKTESNKSKKNPNGVRVRSKSKRTDVHSS